MKDMKDRIKRLRKESNMTQQELSDKLGLKRQTIAAYEMGKIKPSDSTLLLICEKLGINEDWLRYNIGEMKKDIDMNFGDICADIGIRDEKAKTAIMKYYELSVDDKELWWKFVEKFLK